MRDPEDDPESGKDTESDAASFRAAIGPVRRLPETPEPPRPPRRRAGAAMRAADEQAALAQSRRIDPMALSEVPGAVENKRRDEVSPEILRRLKRAAFAVEDEIDLHMLGERAAEDLLRSFLAQARDADHHCVRIVHGKGLHSPQGPVLKTMVVRLLRQRADVLAFASAPVAGGGTGAVLALLARRKPGGQHS